MSRPRSAVHAVLALVVVLPLACGGPDSAGIEESHPPQLGPEVSSLLTRLEQLRKEHREDEGLELARRYLAEHSGTPRLHYAVGVLLGSRADHRGAIREFELELASDPGHFESHRGLALAATLVGEFDRSIRHLEICAGMRPQDPEVAFQLGRNLSAVNRYDEAEPRLTAAARLRDDADSWAELGLLHRRRGQATKAAAAFRRALGRDPNHVATLFNLGQLMVREGDRQTGEALLARHRQRAQLADLLDHRERSSRLGEATPANFTALADAQIRSGDAEEAAASYRRALALDPSSPIAALGLAALLLETGELEEASRWSVVAVLAAPTDQRAHFVLGLVRLARGQVEAADRAFQDSRRLRAWGIEAFLRVADAYERAAAYDRADDAYREAERLAPRSAPLAIALGRRALRRGASAEAAEGLRAMLAREPSAADGWMLLAIASRSLGRERDAEEAWRTAIRLQRIELLAPGGATRIAARFASLPGAKPALEEYLRLAVADGAPGLRDDQL